MVDSAWDETRRQLAVVVHLVNAGRCVFIKLKRVAEVLASWNGDNNLHFATVTASGLE